MKTKILGGIAIVAIAVTVSFNVTLSNKKQDNTSMLALANVEALAQSEGGASCTASANCVHDGKTTGSVGCSGKTLCLSGINTVSCDGIVARCVFAF